jgi:uncharacterized membrane protein YeaQ/YmgE (transglycosylase-associated protein family)
LKEFAMGIIAWIILGLLAGFVASLIVNRHGEGWFLDIILGIVGAVVGGFIAHLAGLRGVTGFNIWSMLVAIGGAVVCLVIYHALTGTRGRPGSPTQM